MTDRGKAPGNPGYRGSYKDNLQKIISAILAAGKIPILAKVPHTTSSSIDISSIREYNVVVDELVAVNNIGVTPPFLPFFGNTEKPKGSPQKNGYDSMANFGVLH
ncbi:MAG: hypothetical protein NCA08_05545 [Deltaproteobacteria bacterium]|nr:hypothetical protein [Candidatus Deferrimicrobium borealis]